VLVVIEQPDESACTIAERAIPFAVENTITIASASHGSPLGSTEMARRYAHLATDHLARCAQRLCALRASHTKNYGQLRHSPQIERARIDAGPNPSSFGIAHCTFGFERTDRVDHTQSRYTLAPK